MLTPVTGGSAIANWPSDLMSNDRGNSAGLPETVDISEYPGTRVAIAPDADLLSGKTTLYCATVQIAWDQLRPSTSSPVIVTSATNPRIDWMNAHPFPLEDLDKAAYFAGVARLGDDTSSAMFDEFQCRFPNAKTKVLPNTGNLPGIRILVYLEKSMPFPDVLEGFSLPMRFPSEQKTDLVNSFGWPSATGEGAGLAVLERTVKVKHYVSNEDFVVQLTTDSPRGDEIILARISPEKSLEATWDSTSSRMKTPPEFPHLRGIDLLQIPILSFGVDASLDELVAIGLPTSQVPQRFIGDARQTIRFRMDEYGAELIADTQMIVGDNGHGPNLTISPLEPRRLVFDRPFLIALKERDAQTPYFLAWIGNSELMEIVKTEK